MAGNMQLYLVLRRERLLALDALECLTGPVLLSFNRTPSHKELREAFQTRLHVFFTVQRFQNSLNYYHYYLYFTIKEINLN